MKRRIRQVAFVLGILISCCLLGGCEGEDKHNVSITLIHAWGGTEKDHMAMREIYDEFQKEYPDINLQVISMPLPLPITFWQLFLITISSREIPSALIQDRFYGSGAKI